MRMLPIHDRHPERRFALLKQQWITALATVAGSRLSIIRADERPGPALCCAMPMNQLVEKNLSPPRVLDCCSSSMNTLA